MVPDVEQQSRPLSGEGRTRNPKHIEDLDISPADEGYIVYRPELDRVHHLNATAVLVLEFCTGENSPEQIMELVKEAYGLSYSPAEEVTQALQQFQEEGLVVWLDALT